MAIGLFRKAASQPPPTAPAPAGSRCDRSRRRTTRAFPHKRTHSHLQRPGDVAWNTANSRNQRTYLIQSYARDMGGGNTVKMREIDVPIRVMAGTGAASERLTSFEGGYGDAHRSCL